MCSRACSHGLVGCLTLNIFSPRRAIGAWLQVRFAFSAPSPENVCPAAGPASAEATAWQAEGVIMNRIIDAIEKEQQKSDGTQFAVGDRDRKSTRLNSSHPSISYAVFCLKKKKKKTRKNKKKKKKQKKKKKKKKKKNK